MPPDVNELPECNNDPRVVANLLDGVNRTQDDMHIWLAPFENGCSHIITVEFEEISTLSMIRIWVSVTYVVRCFSSMILLYTHHITMSKNLPHIILYTPSSPRL